MKKSRISILLAVLMVVSVLSPLSAATAAEWFAYTQTGVTASVTSEEAVKAEFKLTGAIEQKDIQINTEYSRWFAEEGAPIFDNAGNPLVKGYTIAAFKTKPVFDKIGADFTDGDLIRIVQTNEALKVYSDYSGGVKNGTYTVDAAMRDDYFAFLVKDKSAYGTGKIKFEFYEVVDPSPANDVLKFTIEITPDVTISHKWIVSTGVAKLLFDNETLTFSGEIDKSTVSIPATIANDYRGGPSAILDGELNESGKPLLTKAEGKFSIAVMDLSEALKHIDTPYIQIVQTNGILSELYTTDQDSRIEGDVKTAVYAKSLFATDPSLSFIVGDKAHGNITFAFYSAESANPGEPEANRLKTSVTFINQVNFHDAVSEDPNNTGNGGQTGTTPTPTPTPEVETEIEVKATVDGNSVTASVPSKDLEAIVDQAEKDGEKTTVTLTVNDIPSNATEADVTVPAAPLADLAKVEGGEVEIDMGAVGAMTIDAAALKAITDAGSSSNVTVHIEKVAEADLSAEVKEVVGENPVFDFTVLNGTTEVSDLKGGSITVSVDYTPASGVNPDQIVMYYVDSEGNLSWVNGYYDAATKKYVAKLTHLSLYTIMLNEVTFSDVEDLWYKEAIDYLAARELLNDLAEDGKLSPNAQVTRAEFVALFLAANQIDISDATGTQFSDVAADHKYAQAILKARELGLVNGVGDDNFAPDALLKREEFFVIEYRMLQVLGTMPSTDSGKTLSDFTDGNQLMPYAIEPVQALVKAGLIQGNGSSLTPRANFTRAEMCQAVYNVIK